MYLGKRGSRFRERLRPDGQAKQTKQGVSSVIHGSSSLSAASVPAVIQRTRICHRRRSTHFQHIYFPASKSRSPSPSLSGTGCIREETLGIFSGKIIPILRRRKTPGLIRKIRTKKASMTEQSVLRTFSLRVKPGQPRHRKSADGDQSGGDPKRFGRIQCIVESAVYGSFCLGSFWNLNRSKDERQW